MSPSECPVCLEDILPGSCVELECGHRLHGQCAVNCFWQCGLRCPSCRNTSSHFQPQTVTHDDVEVYPATDDEDDAYRREEQELVNTKKEIARRIRNGDKRVQRSKKCMEEWKQKYYLSSKDVRKRRKALAMKRKQWSKKFDEDHKEEIKSFNAARSQSYKMFGNYVDIQRRLHDKIKRELRTRGEADRHDSQGSIENEQVTDDIWNDMRLRAYAYRNRVAD